MGCWRALQLAVGAAAEPLVHPKPGGATRCSPGRGGLSIWSFARALPGVVAGLLEACRRGCSEGCLGAALDVYVGHVERTYATNTSLGTLLLLAPLACTSREDHGSMEEHAKAASLCVAGLGERDARAYYRALERLYPSHLGASYKGPLPGVGSGRYPRSMIEILLGASWDLVHRELLEGYPRSLEVAERLSRQGCLEEESIVLETIRLLAAYGDTLIARRNGARAYLKSMAEARAALRMVEKGAWSPREAALWLREWWGPRGWSPGAVLDIIATGVGLCVAWSSRGGRGPS